MSYILTLTEKLNALDPASQSVLYVDKNSTKTVEDGEINTPFKTIQAAVDQADADHLADVSILSTNIFVAPGSYSENVDVGKANLRGVSLIAEGGFPASSITSIGSTASPLKLQRFLIRGFELYTACTFLNPTSGSEFGDWWAVFDRCILFSTLDLPGGPTWPYFFNCFFYDVLTAENINCIALGCRWWAGLALSSDSTTGVGYHVGATRLILMHCQVDEVPSLTQKTAPHGIQFTTYNTSMGWGGNPFLVTVAASGGVAVELNNSFLWDDGTTVTPASALFTLDTNGSQIPNLDQWTFGVPGSITVIDGTLDTSIMAVEGTTLKNTLDRLAVTTPDGTYGGGVEDSVVIDWAAGIGTTLDFSTPNWDAQIRSIEIVSTIANIGGATIQVFNATTAGGTPITEVVAVNGNQWNVFRPSTMNLDAGKTTGGSGTTWSLQRDANTTAVRILITFIKH